MGLSRKSWVRYRVVIYSVVAVTIFAFRNHLDWSRLTNLVQPEDTRNQSLVLAGRDLAPALIDALIEHYHRDYPTLAIQPNGGGTNQALEDLLNRRADVAFLSRPPTPAEQELFRQVDGDTAIVMPIGVGGLIVLAGAETDAVAAPALSTDQLAGLLAGNTLHLCDRFYAADPNYGFWAAAARRLGRDPAPVDTATVVYLANDDEVRRAVTNDPRAMGMVVSYDLPVQADPGTAPRIVPVTETAGADGVAANYENVASGDYPLYVPLLVACRSNGGIQGSKFVTHLGSGPGQRQVERAGCVPAWQVLREIILTTDPPVKEKSS